MRAWRNSMRPGARRGGSLGSGGDPLRPLRSKSGYAVTPWRALLQLSDLHKLDGGDSAEEFEHFFRDGMIDADDSDGRTACAA